MKRRACPRVWEAEALRDGRLGEAERMSFERHAPDCPTCAGELQALTDLREVMRQMPVLAIAPLERQRLRASVLRQANERLMSTSHTRGASWAFAAATVVAICFIAVGVVRHFRGL